MLHISRLSNAFALLARIITVGVAVLAVAVISLLLVDRVNTPVAVVDPGIASVDTSNHSRLLILHVDSWRYETALDSTIMPNVARLRRESASWKLETVFEGFTVPAVRAAFSGRDETQLVSLIQNFSFHRLPIGSFYLDASRLGKRTLVVAHDPWVQFGPYFEERLPESHGEDRITLDHRRPAIALDAFRNEKFDIVVCHYESADWVAHEDGIHSQRYRREFAYADSLIAAFAAARGPNDYLLIYGDHGHNETGEHKTGIDIPTFGMLFGPDVKAGVTADPLAMTNIRYIASHAIGIRLRSAAYSVGTISEFLPVSADFVASANAATRGVSVNARDYWFAFAVLCSAALLCWWLLSLVPGDIPEFGVVVAIGMMFAIELAIRMWTASSTFTLFPLLLVALGLGTRKESWLVRLAIAALGLWFMTRLTGVTRGSIKVVPEPTALSALIPLYVAAIASKFLVLRGSIRSNPLESTSSSKRPIIIALAWTTLLALLEYRVWDHVLACAFVAVAGVIALLRASTSTEKRIAQIVVLQALIYFTLRLPLYQLAWIDLFLAALYLLARTHKGVGFDALLVTGTFALTCGWLATSLEWGFLYTLFSADTIEKHVQLFAPFILAKIPLVLVLALVVVDRVPTKRLVAVLFAYTALQFAGAWFLRLAGASGAELWPLAEQGMYLSTFVVAAVAWGWNARAAKAVAA